MRATTGDQTKRFDRRARRGERGAAAVELALILPVLVMLVFGIVEFGRGYFAKTALSAAVREGARERALGGDEVATRSAVAVAATGVVDNPDDPDLAVDAGAACPSTGEGDATVTATYPQQYTIPLIASGTWTITVTGVMRCGL